MGLRHIDANTIEAGQELRLKPVAQGGDPGCFGFHFLKGNCAGRAEADDARDIERAGTQSVLVAASMHLFGDRETRAAASDVERANSFGAINFMAG